MNSLLPKELYFSWEKCKTAAWNSISSRYLVSCIVYFVYSIGMILADGSEVKESERNHFYFQFGVVHLINAVMFMWTWTGKSFADKVMVPEYLNFIGAVLYLWSRCVHRIAIIVGVQ